MKLMTDVEGLSGFHMQAQDLALGGAWFKTAFLYAWGGLEMITCAVYVFRFLQPSRS